MDRRPAGASELNRDLSEQDNVAPAVGSKRRMFRLLQLGLGASARKQKAIQRSAQAPANSRSSHQRGTSATDATSGGADPILGALTYLAKIWGRPVSSDILLAGLPLTHGRVTLELVPRALERVGLSSAQARKRLSDLAEFDMPAMFLDDFGTLAIALGRVATGEIRGYDPQTGADVIVSKERANPKRRRTFLIIKPAFGNTGLEGARDATAATAQPHWLRSALAGHGRSIANVVFAAVFVNLFAIAMPLFTMNVYDRVLPNKATATLWVLAIGLLLVQVFDLMLKLARASVIDYVGRKIDFHMSTSLFDRVINAGLAYRPASTGAFVNRIAQYEVLRDFFTSSTIVMFIDVLFMGLFVYVIAAWMPSIAEKWQSNRKSTTVKTHASTSIAPVIVSQSVQKTGRAIISFVL